MELAEEDARRLLRACGVAPERRPLRVRLSPRSGRGARIMLVGAVLCGVIVAVSDLLLPVRVPVLAWPAVTLSFLLSVLYLVHAPTLHVGADGLALEGIRGGKRFVRYDSVRDVVAGADGAHIGLHDGARLVLRPYGGDTEAITALVRRIRDAMTLGATQPVAARAESLDRRGRAWDDWREALSRMAVDAGGYRSAGMTPDDLMRVVEDVAATAERRVGAALALGAIGDETLARQIRVVAAGCADPRMRIAIERAGEAQLDDRELELALGSEEPTASVRQQRGAT